ncbi:MAG TPA: hypothetical protein ENJ95_03590 [Bacteroidetes bacterium]|nr:hypothetical protein [Bacteroidota bacterium]
MMLEIFVQYTCRIDPEHERNILEKNLGESAPGLKFYLDKVEGMNLFYSFRSNNPGDFFAAGQVVAMMYTIRNDFIKRQ